MESVYDSNIYILIILDGLIIYGIYMIYVNKFM